MPGESKQDTTRPTDDGAETWIADLAWLGGDSLVADVSLEVTGGEITSVSSKPGRRGRRLGGIVLPGLVNAHSHAFHRLLRGRTHRQGGDFWLWRERMYEIAGTLTPESYERLATAVFVEMAMTGITTVGEFHYLHHQEEGVPYDDPNEMGHSLVRAARRAGVRIALLDAGYFSAGFDDRPLGGVQTRFRDRSAQHWLDRVDALRATHEGDADVVVGYAPHSVRAVPETALVALASHHQSGIPIHIHVSEQPAENRECLDATTLTPTGLLDRAGMLGPNTTLVHATHVIPDDVETIGRRGSGICYCATTERDLADGVGPAHEFERVSAPLSVGSDSHAFIDLFEETRGIEHHARLATGRRGVFSPAGLLAAATVNGSASLGFPGGGLSVGSPADFIVIDPDSPRLAGLDEETSLDTVVFAATSADVSEVFVGGRHIVRAGRHPAWQRARAALTDVTGR